MVLLEKCYKFQRCLKSTAVQDSTMLVLRMSTPSNAPFKPNLIYKSFAHCLCALSDALLAKRSHLVYVVVCNSYFVGAVHILVQNIVVCA